MNDEFGMQSDDDAGRLGLSRSRGNFRDLGYGPQGDPDRFRLMERARMFSEHERHNPEPGHLFDPPRSSLRGKGPKGYKRADHYILEDVSERFLHHPLLDATAIDVTVESGELTLSGSVEDLDMKWLAEDIALEVSGVMDVTNEIRVGWTSRE